MYDDADVIADGAVPGMTILPPERERGDQTAAPPDQVALVFGQLRKRRGQSARVFLRLIGIALVGLGLRPAFAASDEAGEA